MAQRPLTTAKMFTASWTERDEAVLVELLRRKIGEIKWDMRDCDSPYARAKLKSKREEYKRLLDKIDRGDYDPNILANELRTHSDFNKLQEDKKQKSVGKYVDTYSDVNFDFESYFTKTRYFGAAAPLVMLILTVLLIVIMLASTFLNATTLESLDALFDDMDVNLSLTSIAYYKLDEGANDFKVKNNGNWPSGSWGEESQKLAYGEVYVDPDTGITPDEVYLCADLGMTSIDITFVDIFKALFRTTLFADQRLDAVEDLDAIKEGYSWYYLRYIRGRADDLKIEKDANGNYNGLAIVKTIATYGTIAAIVLMLLLAVAEVIINIGRLFSYTTRHVHLVPVLILLFGIIALICPAFLELKALTGDAIGEAFGNYFTIMWEDFLYGENNVLISFNLIYAIFLVIPFIISLTPLFFKNREPKTIAYVPKGNKPHTYGSGNTAKAGQPGKARVGDAQKIARAGSRSGYNPRFPAR